MIKNSRNITMDNISTNLLNMLQSRLANQSKFDHKDQILIYD